MRWLWLLLALPLSGQEIYDLLLKNGHVIDPANHRDGQFDIAVTGSKITRVGRDLPSSHARVVVDASQYYVTPGLIDIDTNFNWIGSELGLKPEAQTLQSGVTTAVDGGNYDWRGFEEFKKIVIDHSRTRLLAFLSIGDESDAAAAGVMARKYPETIVGVRSRVTEHGLRFSIAAPRVRNGNLPDTISSGIDKTSVMLPRATMIETMSKWLNLGMTLDQVIERSTVNPARGIHHPELGTLSEGAGADLAVIDQQKGKFGFLDFGLAKLSGDRRLVCVMTVRNGQVVWDTEGLSLPDASKAGPYSNFK